METQIPWFSNESLEIRPYNWETKSELMVKNPMVSGFDVPLKHPNDVFFFEDFQGPLGASLTDSYRWAMGDFPATLTPEGNYSLPRSVVKL